MVNILHIDASPRQERSFSRNLTKEFVTAWQQAHSTDQVDYLDLGHTIIPPGLVTQRKMAIVTARGGTFPPNTPMAAFDFQEPFLRTAFGLMGITDITFIHADNLGSGAEAKAISIAAASTAVQNTVAAWA